MIKVHKFMTFLFVRANPARHLAGILVMMIVAMAFLSPAAAKDNVLIYAAASLKEALEVAAGKYEENCDCKVKLSLAGTGELAHQIENGAPADLFISANSKWADTVVEKLKLPATAVRVIASNELVIAVPKQAQGELSDMAVAALLEKGHFAMGEPGSVPAGEYGQKALAAIGIWEKVKKNAVFTENVRVALTLAARGEVDAAITYASDVVTAPAVKIAYSFKAGTYPEILYPCVVLKSENDKAVAFVDYLSGPIGKEILAKFGFVTHSGSN